MQLAKEDPLFRAASVGKRAGLALLSRDEADQELREYKAQIHNLRQEVNTAKSIITQKDEEIVGLKQQGQLIKNGFTLVCITDALPLKQRRNYGLNSKPRLNEVTSWRRTLVPLLGPLHAPEPFSKATTRNTQR